MAKGKSHDRFNLIIGSILTGSMLGFGLSAYIWAPFSIAWLFSTLFFSPDIDIMPKKRSGVLAFFIFPYSIIMKHRGISHHPLWGTISRIAYGIIFFTLITFILKRMGYINFTEEDFIKNLISFFYNYDYKLVEYKIISWFFAGLFLADLGHIFLDRLTSALRRIWKKITFQKRY